MRRNIEMCIRDRFEDAYKYVLENKEKFLEYADMFGNLNIRHLVQDTQRAVSYTHLVSQLARIDTVPACRIC